MTPPIEVLINCYIICVLINYVPLSFVSFLWYFELTKPDISDNYGRESIFTLFVLSLIPVVNIFTGGIHIYGVIDAIVYIFNKNFTKNDKNNRDSR